MHTPGPWRVGRARFDVAGRLGVAIEAEEGLVATVEAEVDASEDARLIAAAPELLEALDEAAQRIHSEWCGCREGLAGWRLCTSPDNWDHEAQIRAAIAKAEGALARSS